MTNTSLLIKALTLCMMLMNAFHIVILINLTRFNCDNILISTIIMVLSLCIGMANEIVILSGVKEDYIFIFLHSTFIVNFINVFLFMALWEICPHHHKYISAAVMIDTVISAIMVLMTYYKLMSKQYFVRL